MSIHYINTVTTLYESMGYTPYKWVVNTDTPPFKSLEGIKKMKIHKSSVEFMARE